MTLFKFAGGVHTRRRAPPLHRTWHLTQGCVAAPLAAAHSTLAGWPMPQSAEECAAATASLRGCAPMPAPVLSHDRGWHLIAGIFLMGYGLVAIPRTLWRLADVRGRQRLTCHQAGVQARKALDAHK